MNNNQNDQFYTKLKNSIIRGFVSRIIIVTVLSVIVSQAYKYAVNNGYIVGHGFIPPLIVILSIIIGIIVLILYGVHVFKVLKQGFLNLEQQAAITAQQMAQDAQQMNFGYNQYPNANIPYQNINTQTTSTQYNHANLQAQSSSSKIARFVINIIFATFTIGILIGELVLGMLYYQYSNIEKTYYPTIATVISVDPYEKEIEDSNGYTHTETRYKTSYVYTMDGNTYTDYDDSTDYRETGDIIDIYVNPSNYSDSQVKWGDNSLTIIKYIMIGLGVFWILCLSIKIIVSRKRNP